MSEFAGKKLPPGVTRAMMRLAMRRLAVRNRRERPILFSDPMVRAILAGTKSQTRRIFKSPKRKDGAKLLPELLASIGVGGACPYGAVGDRLWVRETWGYRGRAFRNYGPHPESVYLHYRADDTKVEMHRTEAESPGMPKQNPPARRKGEHHLDFELRTGDYYTKFWKSWRPSIYMPRWASRITLEITEVRVERLQSISEADARAEGVRSFFEEYTGIGRDQVLPGGTVCSEKPFRASYECLWEDINGVGSWKANPFVWCISFSRVK